MEKNIFGRTFARYYLLFRISQNKFECFENRFSLTFIKTERLNRVLKFLLFPTYRKYAVAKQQGVSSLAANLRRCLGEV